MSSEEKIKIKKEEEEAKVVIKEEVKKEAKVEIKEEVKAEANQIESSSPDETQLYDPILKEFYSEIDDIKDEKFVSTSKEQIDRLLRPGSTYFNLNPFDVLQIDPYATSDDVKRKYRKLSMYVHPDKNKDNIERAQQAFDALNKAYKTLEDEKERKRCIEVVDEARERVEAMIAEKRKKVKKDGKNEPKIDEDDPDKYRQAIYVMTCKLFADLERLRVKESEKKVEEKKRRAEDKEGEESKSKVQKEWDKNYEDTREGRITSWTTFKTSNKRPQGSSFKPPKHKPEAR